ncbi:hypothetical protein [Pseudomonas sp. EA_35y_Pfl2_R111]|uniref:hypothetical protein n=1 Tax=Pseudomonas sp. EA_35y_Pfl2_R111 TaxID=3088689 RepID=UPI0030DCAA99
MAIWQLKFSLVPVSGLRKHIKESIDILPEYRSKMIDSMERELVESPNYWDGLDNLMKAHVGELSQLLPARSSWSSDASMYGESDGDSIEIWEDDIDCAIDVRNINAQFIKSILEIALKMDCLLVIHDSGKLIEPNITRLALALEDSNAAKFLSDPVSFLKRNTN